MTAIQFILIAIAAFIVLAGLYMVIRSFKRRSSADAPVVNYDKNGIPIIPRHERSIVDQPDLEDRSPYIARKRTLASNATENIINSDLGICCLARNITRNTLFSNTDTLV